MGLGSDSARRALRSAPTGGLGTWRQAVDELYGGSTARAAEAQGVSRRTVQRWMASDEGRSVQSRRANPARLGQLRESRALDRIARGETGARYNFAGGVELSAGGKRGRTGRRSTQSRDTSGFQEADPDGLQAWARAMQAGDEEGAERAISEMMFGPESGYHIPPSPSYPSITRIDRFEVEFFD